VDVLVCELSFDGRLSPGEWDHAREYYPLILKDEALNRLAVEFPELCLLWGPDLEFEASCWVETGLDLHDKLEACLEHELPLISERLGLDGLFERHPSLVIIVAGARVVRHASGSSEIHFPRTDLIEDRVWEEFLNYVLNEAQASTCSQEGRASPPALPVSVLGGRARVLRSGALGVVEALKQQEL
jgi:hypothetical protein